MAPPAREICDCPILSECSKEPSHPIRYDAELAEYYIAFGKSGQMMLYYCPFCGGRIPGSKRSSCFAHVSDVEQQRIYGLFRDAQTEDQVRRKFGKPDRESPVGLMTMQPEHDGQPARGEAFRTLTYEHLSEVADIEFHISDGGRARGTWVQKCIERKSG